MGLSVISRLYCDLTFLILGLSSTILDLGFQLQSILQHKIISTKIVEQTWS